MTRIDGTLRSTDWKKHSNVAIIMNVTSETTLSKLNINKYYISLFFTRF